MSFSPLVAAQGPSLSRQSRQKPTALVPSRPATLEKPTLYDKVINNFYEVTPGKFYRSAQLRPSTLDAFIKQYGIKTVINLRGKRPDKAWWRNEAEVVRKNGVQYFNIAMKATEYTTPANLDRLIDIYQSAPLPILVHCQGGADRTGEACAIWKLLIEHQTVEKALQQLSIKYRHLEIRCPLKRQFIRDFAEMLAD